MLTLQEAYKLFDYLVVAHRGASGTAPENTLASFQKAIEDGAHLIEMDVQATADAIPIVFHDKGISRTTNGRGLASKLNYDDLKKFDSGFWFGEEFKGEHIPSLEEVLSFLSGKILLNIELKNLGLQPELILRNIFELLEMYDFSNKVVISSFYYNELELAKKINPRIPIAPIRIPKDSTPPSKLKERLNCEGFVCSVEEISKEIADDAHRNNLFMGVYSVDNENQLDYVISFGVKAIVTNYPKEIRQLLTSKYKAIV